MIYLRQNHGDDALVEPFLDTREFQVAVWGNDAPEALPPAEIDYSRFPDARDRLYTEAWKTDRTSRGYEQHPDALSRARSTGRTGAPAWRPSPCSAYQALGLRDYARFDMRMLGDEPQILDVNVQSRSADRWTSVFVAAAEARGIGYARMVATDHRVRRRPHAVT